jgi:hypothetical protein
VFGFPLHSEPLVLTRGRDFRWTFQLVNCDDEPFDFPAGKLFVELGGDPVTEWHFDLSGSVAVLKVESEVADEVRSGCRWQLVWLSDGEAAGGDPIARGFVKVQR